MEEKTYAELPEDIDTLFQNLKFKVAEEGALTDWEKSFASDQIARFEKWGAQIRLSEKQLAILKKIA